MPLLKNLTSISEPLAGIPDEDDGMVEAVSSDLILIEGDEDGLSGSGEDRDKEEQVTLSRAQRQASETKCAQLTICLDEIC